MVCAPSPVYKVYDAPLLLSAADQLEQLDAGASSLMPQRRAFSLLPIRRIVRGNPRRVKSRPAQILPAFGTIAPAPNPPL